MNSIAMSHVPWFSNTRAALPGKIPGTVPRPGKKPFNLSYGQKIFLLATLPLMLAVAAIAFLVADQSRALAEREIAALEAQLVSAKRAELKNYLSLARTAYSAIYGPATPDDQDAKTRVTQILSSMIYGQDGYFFVFDYEGNNLVSPRRTELINRNWINLEDSAGNHIVRDMIDAARSGGGYSTFNWIKPSTGEEAEMIAFSVGLQDWRWVIGTGIFVDDIRTHVAAARAGVESRIRETFVWIGAITLGAVLMVFLSGMFLNIRERRLADAKLKKLTQRIIDTQEEERSRVARELHDSISQILVGVRYTLELALRYLRTGDARAGESLERGVEHLNGAIQEVRRISRDLRPGVLDDLGLGPALKALTGEFSRRTGVKMEFETVVFRNLLDNDSKIALYRIAQEALTNIERHADASAVSVKLFGHRSGATMRISDNGCGIAKKREGRDHAGLGLRNMLERMEQLGGTLNIQPAHPGTVVEARMPLTHMLKPTAHPAEKSAADKTAKASA